MGGLEVDEPVAVHSYPEHAEDTARSGDSPVVDGCVWQIESADVLPDVIVGPDQDRVAVGDARMGVVLPVLGEDILP